MKLKGRLTTARYLSCIALLQAALVGCGGAAKPANDADAEARRSMGALAQIYGEYLAANRGVPPKNEESFKKFISDNSAELTEKYKTSDFNALFVSLRDKQPLGVIYGKVLKPSDGLGSPWAVYEVQGVNGVRWAAQTRGAPVELTAEEFARELPGK